MNTFNKFLVILLAVTALFFWVTAILVVWLLPEELSGVLRTTADLMRTNSLLFQGLITAFGASSILVSLLILAGEFSEHEPSVIKLSSLTGGTAFIPLEAVAQRIKSDLELIPLVRKAQLHVKNAHSTIEVLVDLRTELDAHLPTKAEEACRVVREAAEQRLGVRVKDVKVNIQYEVQTRPLEITPQQGEVEPDPEKILVPEALTAQEGVAAQEEPPGTPRQ